MKWSTGPLNYMRQTFEELKTTENRQPFSINIAELLYMMYFAVMLIAKGFGLYAGQKPYTIALTMAAVLFVAKIATTEHSVAEILVIILLTVLCAIIYIHSNEIGEFIILATVMGMKQVSVKRVMKLGLVIWVVTYSASILMALLGLRSDIFRAQDKLGLGYVVRWSLGQPHPNVLQISCIVLCAFILYAGRFRGKKLYIVTSIMLLANLYVFFYSISYTGIALSVMYLGLNLYLTEWRAESPLILPEKIIAIMVVPLCAAFSVFGPICFTGKLWDICNKALNTRFYIAKTYMELNPISLFGSGYCNELPTDLNNLDCSYVFALMHYGIIFFILFFSAYIGLIVYCLKKQMKTELAIILAMTVAAVSEPFFVNPSFKNITLLFLGEFVYVILGHVKGVASKKITLLNAIGKKEINLRIIDVIQNVYDSYVCTLYKRMAFVVASGVAVGLLSAIIYAGTVQMPAAYYMNRDTVQVNGEHGFTIDINNLPDDFEGVFLEYTGPDRPMMRLDGNAVKIEYYRGILSIFIWVGLISAGLSGAVFAVADKKVKQC